MSAEIVFDFLLTLVALYGAGMLAGILFFAALGVPLPATVMVLASGAFAQQGLMDVRVAFLLGLAAAVAGDSLSYLLGRLGSRRLGGALAESAAWRSARVFFRRRGPTAVFLTRWMFTPLALPTNLIAGGSGCRFRRFLVADIAGEAFWLLLFGGIGFLLGGNWELVSSVIGDLGGFLSGLVLVAVGVLLLRRRKRRAHDRVD